MLILFLNAISLQNFALGIATKNPQRSCAQQCEDLQ